MENLHPDITIDILSRLPADSVLQCRQVCKTWRTLLLHPCFTDLHLHRGRLLQLDDHNSNATNVGFLSMVKLRRKGYQLHYGEYGNKKIDLSRKIVKHPRLKLTHYSMVGSCNGLICFSQRSYIMKKIPFYIFNPVTKELMNLPQFTVNWYDSMRCGFGYNPSTNEYKIVIIWYCDELDPMRQVHVYTFGGGNGSNGGRWRPIRSDTSDYSVEGQETPGVFLNGSLHWMNSFDGRIVSFDLADEKFSFLPSPPCYDRRSYYNDSIKFQVLGGWLCVVHNTPSETTDIWLLKKKEKSSTSNYDVKQRDDQYSWTWIREFSIARRGSTSSCHFEPFSLTKSGELLLWYNNRLTLYRYDSKTASLEKIGGYDCDTYSSVFEVIPHMSSFVSLKALGEQGQVVKEIKQTRKRTLRQMMRS